jgi:arylsulfatase
VATEQRPNILWYCTDQQRFDTIRALGNSDIHTPHLDALVKNGVSFTSAYSQAPVCTPSRASFLTGRYPCSHHVHRNGADYFPANETLVTKLLAASGYDCGLVGKLHLSRAKRRIEIRPDDGYRVFHWSHHPQPDWEEGNAYTNWLKNEKAIDPRELYEGLRGFCGAGVPAEYHQTTWCSEMAIRFITEKRDRPWLLSMNPFDPHPPFDPPQEYLDHYVSKTLPMPLFRESDIERQRAFRNIGQQTSDAVNPFAFDPAKDGGTEQGIGRHVRPNRPYDAHLVKACYYGMIELIDAQLGRIIETLRETRQLEKTIIIFSSDHGELLGDHGLIYKGCRFFESLVHVPLIIAWPGTFKKSLRSGALVELVDIAPTLLEAAGLEIPYYMQGKSLFSILNGAAPADFHKPYVVSEFNEAMPFPDTTHGSMYFDGRYKIVVYHGHAVGEIYDLQQDPGEFDNLWDLPGHQDLKLDLLKKHFDAMMKTSDAGIERTGSF